MHPEGRSISPYIGFSCLPLMLIFPAAFLIPVVNYLMCLATVFAALYLAFNKMDILLTISIIGSLGVLFLIHGFNTWMLSFWGIAVIPGAVFGRTMVVGMSPRRAFITGMMVSVFFSLVFFLAVREPFFESMDAMSGWAVSMLGSLDTSEALRADLADNFRNMFELTKRLAPAFLALHGVTLLFLGWLLLKLLLDLLRKFHPGLGGFIYWKMPQVFIYITGLVMLLRMVGPDMMKLAADNALLFVGFFYALFGFAVIEYYLKKVRISLILKILFYIGIVFLQLPGLLMAAIIGLFDSYFDFRKVRAKLIG